MKSHWPEPYSGKPRERKRGRPREIKIVLKREELCPVCEKWEHCTSLCEQAKLYVNQDTRKRQHSFIEEILKCEDIDVNPGEDGQLNWEEIATFKPLGYPRFGSIKDQEPVGIEMSWADHHSIYQGPDLVAMIEELYQDGKDVGEIAYHVPCSKPYISKVLTNFRYNLLKLLKENSSFF